MRKLEDILLESDKEISKRVEDWFRALDKALISGPTILWPEIHRILGEMKAFIGEGGVIE